MKLAKAYEPGKFEEDIYALWEKTKAFKPQNRGNKQTYSVVVPPPNANGDLHIGHALTLAVEDIAVRYHRMKGEAALLLPGADHAGFETQVVYERQLAKEGKSRFDFSREELYEQIWNFVAQNKDNYESQFRKLGASVDWSRYVYTLDKKIVTQAYKTFKKMWDEGLIYRGERLVNFCTFHGTGFADIEVEYQTEMGKMYYIRFPLNPTPGIKDKKDYVLVATTRPETMLGDTAVAVHPDDKRYAQLKGRTITIPLADREVPVIFDEMVDRDFGTGAVKITSAHDPNDFEVAKKHNLPLLKVITEEGMIGHDAPRAYHNLSVEEGRKKVVEELKNQGLLERIEDHEHRVGHCYKCKTVIQPLTKEQWFVDMQPLAKRAIQVLKDKKIKFYPSNKRDQLVRYLQSLKDWNISRQIAWGIPIPAFVNVDDPEDWKFDTRVDQEYLDIDGKTYHRDPDVFDTWFSSSSWPYATLDYPDGEDFEQFYPLSVMETGYDIMYPWVSRMIMMGLYVTDSIPFEKVYLHGLVLDEHGAKMSKSKGNVVNPMDVVGEYGSDALRMGIITGQTPGNNQPFTPAKIVGARNFCNKLWNMARYIEGVVGDDAKQRHEPTPKTIADHWVLSKLQHSIQSASTYLDNYRFAEAYDEIYHLVWDDIADWYLEAGKGEPNQAMLAYVLETILKLTHPFAPFVTETIWQTLKWEQDSVLAVASWPETPKFDAAKAQAFEKIKDVVSEIRYLVSNMQLKEVNLLHTPNEFIEANKDVIARLARLHAIAETHDERGFRLTSTNLDLRLDIDPQTIEKYAKWLKEDLKQQENLVVNLEKRLKNKSYVDNAPETVVAETRAQLADNQAKLTTMQTELRRFN